MRAGRLSDMSATTWNIDPLGCITVKAMYDAKSGKYRPYNKTPRPESKRFALARRKLH